MAGSTSACCGVAVVSHGAFVGSCHESRSTLGVSRAGAVNSTLEFSTPQLEAELLLRGHASRGKTRFELELWFRAYEGACGARTRFTPSPQTKSRTLR